MAKRKLKNIMVKEVSFVDKPANRRPFLFWKRDEASDDPVTVEKKFTKLTVEFLTDGTSDGTKVVVNGTEITQLTSFGLQGSKMGDEFGLYCSYTQNAKGEANGGFRPTYTYTLTKAMDDDGDAIVAPTEAEVPAEATKTDVAKSLDGDLAVVKDYLSDMPPALRASVERITGAVGGPEEIKKETETMPEANKAPDGESAVPQTVDVKAIAASVAEILQPALREALSQEAKGIAEKLQADQKAAAEQAKTAADEQAAKVVAGELVEFASEDDLMSQLAAEANAEALAEAVDGDGKTEAA